MSWKSRIGSQTLVARFLVPMLLLTMVLLATLGAAMVIQNQRTVRGLLQSKAEGTARLLAQISAPYVVNYDLSALEGFVRKALEDREVAFVVFNDADGKPLTETSKVPADVSALSVYRLNISDPSTAKVVGHLHLGYKTTLLQSALRSALASIAVMTVIALLLLAGGVTMLFRNMTRPIHHLIGVLDQVAQGDLTVNVDTSQLRGEMQQLGTTVDQMRARLRELVVEIKKSSSEMNSSSTSIFAAVRQQEQIATQHSSAIEETRRTMDSLLGSARSIAESSEHVLQNAELTLTNNQQIAERNQLLSTHVQRIADILEIIKDIANKSDLLALNAGLEGTKAGEAGRGFSLVAAQMQRLAENVMGSVQDIKKLVTDIRDASQSAVMVTQEGTKLAEQTTRSAQQIRLITQQQEGGTEQVTVSMEDAARQLSQTVVGLRDTTEALKKMNELSTRLRDQVQVFQV